MEELSLVIRQPEDFLKHITWNKEELKQLILQKVADYQNMVYTEDAIKSAKSDRAYLNKLKKSISDRRIEVKKAVMAPYTEFENDVKEVLELIDEPINQIDGQIKAYENDQREARKQVLKMHYETTYSESFRLMVPFERLLNDKMLLLSKSEKKAISEMDEAERQINTDLLTIDMGVQEQDRDYAHQRYLSTFNVTTVFSEIREMMERRKAEAVAREAQRGAERSQEPQAGISSPESTEEQIGASVDAQSNSEPERVPVAESAKEKVYVSHFAAYGTKTQLFALRDFMVANGIRFESLAKEATA